MIDQPTGIIRTLPGYTGQGKINFDQALLRVEQDADEYLYVGLPGRPRLDVLHLYLCFDGRVQMRFNLAGYRDGVELETFDGRQRTPRIWAICTGPISRPPAPIERRGFQGFRYTTDLW